MTNIALRAGLLSASGTCLTTTEAERRPQSASNMHMVFANEELSISFQRIQDCIS